MSFDRGKVSIVHLISQSDDELTRQRSKSGQSVQHSMHDSLHNLALGPVTARKSSSMRLAAFSPTIKATVVVLVPRFSGQIDKSRLSSTIETLPLTSNLQTLDAVHVQSFVNDTISVPGPHGTRPYRVIRSPHRSAHPRFDRLVVLFSIL